MYIYLSGSVFNAITTHQIPAKKNDSKKNSTKNAAPLGFSFYDILIKWIFQRGYDIWLTCIRMTCIHFLGKRQKKLNKKCCAVGILIL